jgi:hypothetical protein
MAKRVMGLPYEIHSLVLILYHQFMFISPILFPQASVLKEKSGRQPHKFLEVGFGDIRGP